MDPSIDLGAGSLVDDVDADDLHVLEGLVVPVGLDAADDVHDGHSLDDGPEYGVGVGGPGILLVQVCVVDGVDEELASSGVWLSRVGHGHRSPDVGVSLAELVLDGVPGSAHSGSGGVSALDHESVDDPVEDGPVVELSLIHI